MCVIYSCRSYTEHLIIKFRTYESTHELIILEMELQIAKVENLGKKLILDDTSEWEIIYFDSLKSVTWLPSQKVIVREKKDMDSWTVYTNTVYPYTTIIEHVDSGKMVGAMRVN